MKLQTLVVAMAGSALLFAQAPPVPPGATGNAGFAGPGEGRGPGGEGRGPGGRGRGQLGGQAAGFVVTPVIDTVPPELPADLKPGGILIFSKTSGFREEAAIQASDVALAVIAKVHNWPYFITENGAVMNAEQLAKFKLVIWNNTSGDSLNDAQKAAFQTWVENGGSVLGTHGAGGDPVSFPAPRTVSPWKWFIDTLLGAQFTSHSAIMPGDAHVVDAKSPITKGLPAVIRRADEWYAFTESVSKKPGYHVLITADEKSYTPGRATMGADHPLAWWHCVGKGHVVYSALGHGGMMYAETPIIQLLENAMAWGLAEHGHACPVGK